MATVYVKFQSSTSKVNSCDCTTRWDDDIRCSIPISKIYENKYTNLMKMTGDVDEIAAWIAENEGKVVEITEAEGDAIGQAMVPEGTINIIEEFEGDKIYRKTYTAGKFTMAGGQNWTLTESVDITPE